MNLNPENLNLIAQLIESMELASKELEKALNRNNVEKFNRTREEILRFQKQMAEMLA